MIGDTILQICGIVGLGSSVLAGIFVVVVNLCVITDDIKKKKYWSAIGFSLILFFIISIIIGVILTLSGI